MEVRIRVTRPGQEGSTVAFASIDFVVQALRELGWTVLGIEVET